MNLMEIKNRLSGLGFSKDKAAPTIWQWDKINKTIKFLDRKSILNFFVDERLGRIPDPLDDDKFVGIYIRLYPEYQSNKNLAYDSTTSSNRNWDLTHKISESTEKSETDKIKSAPRKFYERLMQKHEPIRPNSRAREKYATNNDVVVDLYPTKTIDDRLDSSLRSDKNAIQASNQKYSRLGVVKHNKINESINTTGINSSAIKSNVDPNKTLNLKPSSSNRKKQINAILYNNTSNSKQRINQKLYQQVMYNNDKSDQGNTSHTTNNKDKNGTHSPGSTKNKKRADKNSYQFNNSLISVLHNNTYNFKETTEDIYGGSTSKSHQKKQKLCDKIQNGVRKSSLNNSIFVNNTLKSSSVTKKRKRSLSPQQNSNVSFGKSTNATNLSIKSNSKQKSDKLRFNRKKKSSEPNMHYTAGIQMQSNIPPINPQVIYSKYYGTNPPVEKKARGLFFKKDEKGM